MWRGDSPPPSTNLLICHCVASERVATYGRSHAAASTRPWCFEEREHALHAEGRGVAAQARDNARARTGQAT
eukprot:4354176-Alexandrium_andersonii.AAC.1